ncbi:hypothetical protein LINGRAHAP2_LOCUS9857 [Linum grandiflorum]
MLLKLRYAPYPIFQIALTFPRKISRWMFPPWKRFQSNLILPILGYNQFLFDRYAKQFLTRLTHKDYRDMGAVLDLSYGSLRLREQYSYQQSLIIDARDDRLSILKDPDKFSHDLTNTDLLKTEMLQFQAVYKAVMPCATKAMMSIWTSIQIQRNCQIRRGTVTMVKIIRR